MRANCRDVLLSDDCGKSGLGKQIRSRFCPFALSLAHSTQYGGGFNGGGAAFTQRQIILIVDAALHHNQSAGGLYLGVVAAFASMLRRIVFDEDSGDEKWLHSLAEAGFSQAFVQYVSNCSWILGPIAGESEADPGSTYAMDYNMLKQLTSNSWVPKSTFLVCSVSRVVVGLAPPPQTCFIAFVCPELFAC